MAEFVDVLRQFDRMCWYYQRKRECPMGCPMNGVNISQCRKLAFEEPKDTEKTVMAWAAEHKEPVYPSFLEWLHKVLPNLNGQNDHEAILELIKTPILDELAQKLGIEPKEG